MLAINQLAWLAEAPICGVSGSAESEATVPSGVALGLQVALWHRGGGGGALSLEGLFPMEKRGNMGHAAPLAGRGSQRSPCQAPSWSVAGACRSPIPAGRRGGHTPFGCSAFPPRL